MANHPLASDPMNVGPRHCGNQNKNNNNNRVTSNVNNVHESSNFADSYQVSATPLPPSPAPPSAAMIRNSNNRGTVASVASVATTATVGPTSGSAISNVGHFKPVPKLNLNGSEQICVQSEGDPSLLDIIPRAPVILTSDDAYGSETRVSSASTMLSNNPARIHSTAIGAYSGVNNGTLPNQSRHRDSQIFSSRVKQSEDSKITTTITNNNTSNSNIGYNTSSKKSATSIQAGSDRNDQKESNKFDIANSGGSNNNLRDKKKTSSNTQITNNDNRNTGNQETATTPAPSRSRSNSLLQTRGSNQRSSSSCELIKAKRDSDLEPNQVNSNNSTNSANTANNIALATNLNSSSGRTSPKSKDKDQGRSKKKDEEKDRKKSKTCVKSSSKGDLKQSKSKHKRNKSKERNKS